MALVAYASGSTRAWQIAGRPHSNALLDLMSEEEGRIQTRFTYKIFEQIVR